MTLCATVFALLIWFGGLSASAQQLYTVQPQDTLLLIALQYGTSVEALAIANDIEPPYIIHAGAQIWLADSSSPAQRIYVTQPGDNLFRIALRFGTTPEALAAANGLKIPYTIHAGARLVIADPGDLPQDNYIVRLGDTLYRIANRKGITVEELAAANGIQPPYIIHAGTLLIVPAPFCPQVDAAPDAEQSNSCVKNACHNEWNDCGDGSTHESTCRWKVGWCVACLGKTVEDCRCRLGCGCPEPEPKPEPKRAKSNRPTKVEPICVLKSYIDDQGKEIVDTRNQICYKECLAGVSDEDLQAAGCEPRQ